MGGDDISHNGCLFFSSLYREINSTFFRDVGNSFIKAKYAILVVFTGIVENDSCPVHVTCDNVYLDQQIHDISRHLLYQDVNHSQYLSLGSGQSGGVNVLLRLGVRLSCVVPMNLEKTIFIQSYFCAK